jgi:superfamily II DNA or RNA helicase
VGDAIGASEKSSAAEYGVKLRNYQLRTLDDVRAVFVDGRRAALVVAPTGAGKTAMASAMAAGHVQRLGRVVFLAHRIELVEQAAKALQSAGLEVGYRGLGAAAPTQVCMIQTLARRGVAPDGTLVIFDEAHHGAKGNDWTRVWRGYLDSGARGVGLTATPARADDKALDGFDALVVSTSIRELTAQGYLVPVRWKGPRRPTGKDRIAMTPAEAWDKFARGRATVVFAPHVQAATDYRDELRKVGARCEVVSERSTPEARAAALMSLEHGALDVVCNVQVLTEGWDCLDEQTEILAERGWIGMGQVRRGERMWAVDPATHRPELVTIDDTGNRNVNPDEKMVRIKSQHVDVRVTEGHSLRVINGDDGGGHLEEMKARDLVGRRGQYEMALSPSSITGPGLGLSDDELKLAAWVLTDGTTSDGRLEIYQSKRDYVAEIRGLLDRLTLPYAERVRGGDRLGAYANGKALHVFGLRRQAWASLPCSLLFDKSVGPAFNGLSREQFSVLWSEMLKGDGEQHRGRKSGWLWCNPQQADRWSALATLRGFAVSVYTRVRDSFRPMCRVSVRDRRTITSNPVDARSARTHFEAPASGESVWCVTNRLGTVIARRNGKVLVMGNCPRVSCVMIARRVGSQALWIQMTGRGLRPLAGKRDCLLLDLCGQAHLLGLPDEDRTYSLDGDGIALSRPAATAVRVCRVCGCQLAEGQVKCEECGKDHSLVTPISVGGELVDWRASYVAVRDSLQPSRQALALAGILRRAKASRVAWQPGAVIRRFKGIFGYPPSAETIAMAKELNAQADAELRRRART